MRAFFLAATLGALASAADVYVSPAGSDSNTGASGSPFKTLPKAQQAVRTLLAGSSASEDITVHVADGVYALTAPLVLTAADSGKDGRSVTWRADGTGATVSGGIRVTGWTAGSNGVYSAAIPAGTKSRNLYVAGKAANFARRKLANRKDFSYTQTGMSWTSGQYDWLQTTAGIAGAEVRFINSFTDRYAPIQSVGSRQLVMVQNSWRNNIIGYDTVNNNNADFGVWVQNALALLSEGGQAFVDSAAGKVYYKPLAGEDMATVEAYLGVQEVLVAIGGTSYEDPAHDIVMSGLNFAHTTWMKPAKLGYVDQQTGAYIGEDVTYPAFEATRPKWFQMPSAVQVSAARNILLTGGSYTQLGGGGVGIGNDNNAHLSGVGLGAKNVTVTEGFFAQVMGNSVTGGGVQGPAHHPDKPSMVNSQLVISNNVFSNVSALFSSTVPILATYVQYSTISHNDLSQAPYSGICHGYGWGSNDAGGSPEYEKRGLYAYQPKYSTPTTSQNNLVHANLIHAYGLSHTDLGALYTLSKSPSSQVTENYAFDSSGFGMYTDEGSNSYAIQRNVLLSNGIWSAVNGVNTANNSYVGNFYKNGSGRDGNYQVNSVGQAAAQGQRVAYRAGVTPGKRAGKRVSNPSGLADGYLGMSCSGGTLTLTLWNFDDLPFTGVRLSASANGATLTPGTVPDRVAGDTWAQATYRVSNGQCPSFTAQAQYTNSRTGGSVTLNGVNAAPPSAQQPPPSGTQQPPAATNQPPPGQACASLYGQCGGSG
jgi:hypothetical protein